MESVEGEEDFCYSVEQINEWLKGYKCLLSVC